MARIFNAKVVFESTCMHGLQLNPLDLLCVQLFEVCAGVDERVREVLLTTLRSVCVSAAVDSQPTVLLLSNTDALTLHNWEKVRLLMENGT